ncbi:desmoglein-2-like protein [Conger conger]|uniref:desmoglein-2-like protein n=1 Tax=Conger conger TaxID=82655 RepID=UPI002A59AFE9|nr:desmoglein-2-like protein [Conger conger]
MERDVREFVAACPICARGKGSHQSPSGLLRPLPIPRRPWSHIALDFIMELPPSEGKTVILVVVDRFSKAAHFVALPKLPSAVETARLVIDHVFKIHGLPQDVVSDRGPQFASRFWRAFCSLLGASVSLSSGFHPETNGQTERTNHTLENTLRCLAAANPSSWSRQLTWAEYAHNTLQNASTGLLPFEAQFGYPPPPFPEPERGGEVPSAETFVRRCRSVWKKIGSNEENRTSIRYSLTGPGVDKEPYELFKVDKLNGQVKVNKILDREKMAVYELKGMAKFENGATAETPIVIRIVVEDENDNDPVFPEKQEGAVSELSQSGTFVMKINATDADDPQTANGQVTYSILEQIPDGRSMFSIKETGEIYVQQSTLDRETHSSYLLKVKGTDMKGEKGCRTGTGTVTINILDVNDNVPTLDKSHYEESVMENTSKVEVLRIKAKDLDSINTDNWHTVFSIVSGNEAGYFAITTDEKTNEGVVTVIQSLDYEKVKEVNLKVAMHNKAAYHSSVVSAPGEITIKIKVKNKGPMFIPATKVISVSENSKVVSTHTVIDTYAAIDGDTLVTAKNIWYAKLNDPANWLIIDEKTAEIKLNQIPDRESEYVINGNYTVKIICQKNDIPAKTATGTIVLVVEDVNDNCPTLTNPNQIVCSSHTALPVSAKDRDADPNGPPFRFQVVPEGAKQEWTVEPANSTSVILRANQKLWPGRYKVQLDVWDQQGKACDKPQVLKLEVCTCEGEKTCVPSATFGVLGLGTLLLALLLLLSVPLLLVSCMHEGLNRPINPTKQQLINSITEDTVKDVLRIYKDEGQESPISMGSVLCRGCEDRNYFEEADNNLDFLNNLGPRFETLAEICMGSAIKIDSVYSTAPVLPTTRYISTLLLTDRPGSTQGVYVVNEALRVGEMVPLREQGVPVLEPEPERGTGPGGAALCAERG